MTEAAKALVEAQKEMGRAHKGGLNPHFRKNYASLSDVMDACYPALHKHGFAVIQPQGRDESGDFVDTVLLHESGERFCSRVYLIVDKQDMQRKGSAITYARRYGLIALAGIADTDDDGNAASEPRRAPQTGGREKTPADTGKAEKAALEPTQALRDGARLLYQEMAALDHSDRPAFLESNVDLMTRIRAELPEAADHIDRLMQEAA